MKTLVASVLLVTLSGCGGWHHARGQCAQAAVQPQPAPQVIVVTVPPGSTVVTPGTPAK